MVIMHSRLAMKRHMLASITVLSLLIMGGCSTPAGTDSAETAMTTAGAENQIGDMLMSNQDYSVYETKFERDGKQINGNLYLPNTSAEKYPTVIISHGYEGSHEEMAPYAEVFAAQGIAAYVFDFCGGSYSSRSDGETTEMSVLTEEADLTAVMDGLASIDRIDDSMIFLMGESQGGMVSALAAADQASRVRALVLLYPALVIPDHAREEYSSADEVPETSDLMGMTVGKIYYTDVLGMDVYQQISRYTGSVLILHGDRDNLVPISYSQKAVQMYSSASLTVIKNGGHGFYGSMQKEAAEDALNFIESRMHQ